MNITHTATNFLTMDNAYLGFTCKDGNDIFAVAFTPSCISLNDADDSVTFSYEDCDAINLQAKVILWASGEATFLELNANYKNLSDAERPDYEAAFASLRNKLGESVAEAVRKHFTPWLKAHAAALYQDFLSVKC